MRRTLLLTALFLVATAPVAEGAQRHVVRGAGWGHGIGLSQFGTKGYAENGRSYRQILAHYYQGTELGDRSSQTIRVLLQSGRSEIQFTEATRAPGKRLSPNRTYRARRYGINQVELRTRGGKLVKRFDAPLVVSNANGVVKLLGTTINGVTNGRFRDRLEIRPGVFGGMGAINALSLDDYVRGVIPGEMPAAWHEEALKAQAVAARSYAIATDAGGAYFDQYPDTRSQVYRGVGGEHPRANAAVEATSGEVVTHSDRVIATFFFSTSGGRTENVENVFYGSSAKPYLVSVSDPYDKASPKHRWTLNFTKREMQAKLGDLVKGSFRRIKVLRRGASPRVVWAEVHGSRGKTKVRGATLRARLGLNDTWAYFTRVRTSAARARSSSWTARLTARPTIVGSIVPRPRSRRFNVERKTSKGWRRSRRARTRSNGSFRVSVRRRGTYRVRAGRIVGPAVRVR